MGDVFPERKAGFEGLFCTLVIKLLFCLCGHLLTRLTIVMKAQVQLAALCRLGINLKVAYLFKMQSDWVFIGLLLWCCRLG